MKKCIFIVFCLLILLSSCKGEKEEISTSAEVMTYTSRASEGFTTFYESNSITASTLLQETQVSLVTAIQLASKNQTANIAATTQKKEESKAEVSTRKWPVEMTPKVEKSAELIYQCLSKIEFDEPFSERNAAAIAVRFDLLDIPEIIKVDVAEIEETKQLEDRYKNYKVQFIDINGQDYCTTLTQNGSWLWIEKGAGENRETIYFRDSGRPDGWQP